MDELLILKKMLGILIVGITGVGLTLARRYKNDDKHAGVGVSFGTLTIMILIWFLTI